MYIRLNLETDFEIKSLTDLPKFKQVMEQLKMKINKSRLAQELGVDRRTIDKYYEVISALLSEDSKQKFYYRRVLWQYLKDNHGLNCAASTFREYIVEENRI